MDFDLTQKLQASDTEGEEEDNKRSPVAHIKILNQPTLKTSLYPIHKGDNTVGRQDLCQVSIPVRSLSKKHACIEVRGRSHFIYDMGSRNRTRRGTHYLTPEVRYELRNNDMVVFADVSCIYLVEDSARASDSGSETDPMSESETVFHTVAVDMYNSVESTVNRIVEPELIDIAVTSDPNSCDSGASSDILMPTQDFAVSKHLAEPQIQTKSSQDSKSSQIKDNNNKKRTKILVVDSDLDDENMEKKDTLQFQNNGHNEDSMDMDLLTAATQAYVADSEDDDNNSEILDMVQDYKSNEDEALFVPDSPIFNSPTSLNAESTKKTSERNGSVSPFQSSLALSSPRTYSKKNKNDEKNAPKSKAQESPTPENNDKELEKDDDMEETQDPNLFAMSTLVAEEEHLCDPVAQEKNPSPIPTNTKNSSVQTNVNKNETLGTMTDNKETLLVDKETLTLPVNNDELATAPISTNDEGDTLPVSDTLPVKSLDDISKAKHDSTTLSADDNNTINSVLHDVAETLIVGVEELASVEVTTEEPSGVPSRETETLVVDKMLAETASIQNQPVGKNSPDDGLSSETEKESDNPEPRNEDDQNQTFVSSNKASSSLRIISGTESKNKPLQKSGGESSFKSTPVKETEASYLNSEPESAEDNGIFSVGLSSLRTPINKDKFPSLLSRQSDEEGLEATQPYTITSLDSLTCKTGESKRANVQAKRSLLFINSNNLTESNKEEDTQPQVSTDIDKQKKVSIGQKRGQMARAGDHEISDNEEEEEKELVEIEPKVRNSQGIKSERAEDNANEKMSSNVGSQTNPFPSCTDKTVLAIQDTEDKETSTELQAVSSEVEIQFINADSDPTQIEEDMPQLINADSDPTQIEEDMPQLINADSDPTQIEEDMPQLINADSDPTQIEEDMPQLINADSDPTQIEEDMPQLINADSDPTQIEEDMPQLINGDSDPTQMEEDKSVNNEENRIVSEESSNLTIKPKEVLNCEGASASNTQAQPKTKGCLKKVEENKEMTVKKRGRKAKSKEKNPESTTTSVSQIDSETNEDEEDFSVKKNPRIVHFVGLSSSEESLHDATRTCLSYSGQELKENPEEDEEFAMGRRKNRKSSGKQVKSKKENNNSKCTEDPNEGSLKGKRTRGRPPKIKEEKDSTETETNLEEKSLNQPHGKKRAATRSATLDGCGEDTIEDDSTRSKKPRGCRSKSTNENSQKDEPEGSKLAKTEDASETAVNEEPSAKTLKFATEMIPKEIVENPVKSSDVNFEALSLSSRLEETTSEEQAIEELEKRTKNLEVSHQNSNTENSKSTNSSNDSKTEIKESVSTKRTSDSHSSKLDLNANITGESETVLENNCLEPALTGRRRRSENVEKSKSEESDVSAKEPVSDDKIPQSRRTLKAEEKVPETVKVFGASPRISLRRISKRKNPEEGVSEETAKGEAPKRQGVKKAETCADKNKSVKTTRRSSRSLNAQKDEEDTNSLISSSNNNNNDDDRKMDQDNDNDFVASVPLGKGIPKRKTVSEEKTLSPSPQPKNVDGTSNLCEDNANPPEEFKTPIGSKKRNQNNQSKEGSPVVTPKRQRLHANHTSSPDTPSSRRSSLSDQKPKVMFTGVSDEKLQKIVTDLGGNVVTSFDGCTHLVTDKVRGTVKFLCCLARGIPIVSPSWLMKCKSAKIFTDHTPHIVSDPNSEKLYNFSLKNSLQQARNGPLLDKYKIHVTKSVKPNIDQMKEIMESCKAKFLKRMPNQMEEHTVVISCEEDRTLCQPALNAGLPVVNAEFILAGILQYDLSLSKYQIFDSLSGTKRNSSSTEIENATATKRRRR